MKSLQKADSRSLGLAPDGGRDDAVPEQEAAAQHEPLEQQRKIRGLLSVIGFGRA